MKRTKTPEEALRLLMAQCAKSEKSTGDAMRALARWGVDADKREAIVARLVRERFIDDRRFASAYVREKAGLSRWGIHKIRAGLRAKGVAEDIVAEALEGADNGAMRGKLDGLLQKKMKTIRAKNSYELRGKLMRYGAGLGFGFEDIAGAVDRLVAEDGEE